MHSSGDFCEGGIWNTSLLLDQTWPEFTPCFVVLVRICVPCLYVWLLLPFFIRRCRGFTEATVYQTVKEITDKPNLTYQALYSSDNEIQAELQRERSHHTRDQEELVSKICLPISRVTILKIVFVIIQLIVTLIEVIELLVLDSGVLHALAGFLFVATYILLGFMLWYEKAKGCTSSHFLFFYFFLMELVLGVSNVYMWIAVWGVDESVLVFTTTMVLYVMNVACLVLTFFDDNPASLYQPIGRPNCPETTSTYPSTILFTWMRSLMISGYRQDLTFDDVWKLNPRDTSRQLTPAFEDLWKEEVERAKRKNEKRRSVNRQRTNDDKCKNGVPGSVHYSNSAERTYLLNGKHSNQKEEGDKASKEKVEASLFMVMAKLLWKETVIALIKRIAGDVFMFLGPLILGALITFLQNHDEEKVWQAYALSVSLLVTGLLKSVFFAQAMYAGSLIGLKFKTILTTAIYKKALTISGAAKKNTTVGEIVNLMSVDCQRLQEMMAMFLFTWSTPFQLLLATALLYRTLGVSSFAGVFLMALTVPLNYMLSQKQKFHQMNILALKDDRIRLVNEIINGMKVLKFYAWELEFKKKVQAIRELEIHQLFKIANLSIVLNTVSGLMPFLMGMVTFITYVLIDRNNVLDAKKAFVALALFNLLRTPMIYIATAIVFAVQTVVCMKRINTFLNLEDLDPLCVSHDDSNKYAIEIKSGTFCWERDGRHILSDINVEIEEGSLVAVIGPIGSGKSSLVSSILGEIHKQQGYVNVKGRVGYVSQQAWIQNATVRDNIVFGSEYDRRRYNTTIKACQLVSDFDILDGGDKTEIGERGINISGGQKQRINLARAAYSQSDVFLFDDPLSAVDAHVGKAIFEQLIGPQGILAGKTRVLVTHGLQWLPKVDKIIVLYDGHITDQGTYNQLMESSEHFNELINLYTTESSPTADEEGETPGEVDKYKARRKSSQTQECSPRERKMSSAIKYQDSFEFDTSCTLLNSVKSIHAETSKLTVIETLEKGKISRDVYTTYIKAAGVIAIPLSFVAFVLFYASLILSNFWLAEWTEDSILLNKSTRTSDEGISTSNYYMLIYGLFGVGQVVMRLLHYILFWYAMVRAGQRLHRLLLERLFHAPMSFFDQTPVGRILNRFSRDVDIVDNNLPIIIKDFIMMAFGAFGTLVVVMVKTPVIGAVLIPLFIVFYLVQSFYVRTSRQLKRMESIARSPVYTHFSETVTGATAIRAYGVTERFIAESEEKIDENQVYYFASQAAIRWLQLNMDVLTNLVVLFAAVLQVLDGGGGSDAGLSVSYALQITGVMTYMVRQVCEFETNIVCIERMKEYSRIEQEADLIIPRNRPASEWPQQGNVEFCDYQLRYRPGLQLVLKGVNCHIRPAEKVGIVGRTGAGKSSLTLGLFRIIESAGGFIKIDGVNIAQIGLHDLRKKLTILPQDPVLFSGSLRMNIDPFNEFEDTSLWKALEHSHLKEFVAGQPEGLMYECGEEGTNLSVGQRQLVCLARALLRKTKILVLDEATAAVDLETDALIQTTIRDAFHDCTILAIAHRLQTIMDHDKVIVMDVGVVKEFDPPEQLIKQRGVFYSMCKDAGLA